MKMVLMIILGEYRYLNFNYLDKILWERNGRQTESCGLTIQYGLMKLPSGQESDTENIQ